MGLKNEFMPGLRSNLYRFVRPKFAIQKLILDHQKSLQAWHVYPELAGLNFDGAS